MNFHKIALVVASGLSLLPFTAQAFTLTPMSVSFDPSGPGATRSFQVDNASNESVALEVYVTARDMNVDGQENFKKNPDVEKKFLIYPPTLVLKPHEKRTLRVSWNGGAQLERELAYRIVVEQLPVKTEKQIAKKGAVINMLLRYVGAIYITPPQAKAQVVLKEGRLVPGKKPKLNLLFENQGTAHQILSDLKLKISPTSSASKDAPIEITPDQIPDVAGQNILAGMQRRFTVPWPAPVPKAPVQVDFEIKDR